MSRDVILFLGPTLPADEATRLLPGARILPPAAAGDVYRAAVARRAPAVIALVDGFFERTAAPWHKELLFALERGVAVYGASSMGALRAAELAPLGMIGVGRVYAAYRAGRITRDDEVAVAHGPAEMGWPQVSEALVNVRFALAAARRRELVSARVADEVLALAAATFWRERRWPGVLAEARKRKLPARPIAALERFVRDERPNQKRDDARALLRRIARDLADDAPRARPRESLARTWFWRVFEERHAPPEAPRPHPEGRGPQRRRV